MEPVVVTFNGKIFLVPKISLTLWHLMSEQVEIAQLNVLDVSMCVCPAPHPQLLASHFILSKATSEFGKRTVFAGIMIFVVSFKNSFNTE